MSSYYPHDGAITEFHHTKRQEVSRVLTVLVHHMVKW